MRLSKILKIGIASTAMLLAAACTGSDSSSPSADGTSPSDTTAATQATEATQASTAAKPVDTLNVALSEGDTPDPAYGGGILPLETTQALLTFGPRVNGKVGALAPGLAAAIPEPTDEGTTYTFQLAPGITYSDGTPIKASDFKFAIERLYRADSGYVGKFGVIKGALEFGTSRKGGISGILADDGAATVTFHLTAPTPTFPQIMAQFFTAPLPQDTPDAQTNDVPSTGPMMLDAFSPDEGYTLVVNPAFKASDAVAASNVAKIVATVVADPGIALTKTLDGTYDYDDETIPSDQIADLLTNHADQTKVVPVAETNMFSMNMSRAPFNDLRVRQAVNYAIDRDAMAKLSGGTLLPTMNVLPPGESSFTKITTYGYDLDKAKQLIDEAGVAGTKVSLLAAGDPSSEPYVVYLGDQLKKIGLVPDIKVVPMSTFFGVPTVPATDPDMSWYPWNEFIPDGSDWIGQLFDGTLINDTNNKDWSMLDDPAINAEIAAASLLPLGSDRDAAWAELDRKIVEDMAVVAPYGNPARIAVVSSRIDPQSFTQFVGAQALLSNLSLK